MKSTLRQKDLAAQPTNKIVAPSGFDYSENKSQNILLPLRLFLGVTFVYAGIQKITDPQFFHKGTPGYIGNQLIGFAHGSPLHNILMHQLLSHAVLLGWAVALGEIAIGLGTLFGFLFRPASFFGLLLSFIFFLTASWHVYPYFYGADIVFVFCWITVLLSGPRYMILPSIDGWLLKNLFSGRLLYPGNFFEWIIAVILSGDWKPAQASANNNVGQSRMVSRRNYAMQVRERRRSFLYGILTGGATVVGLSIVASVLHVFGNDSTAATGSATSSTASQASSTTGSSSTSASTGTTIGKVSAIPKNSATTFTLPSSGDPGVLIHLPDDQFVAYDATCTHAGCQVGYDQASHNLICPCHGAEYDPANGASVLQGPAPSPLTSVKIQIDNSGNILME